jgi:peptide-methionine (S)-S-oxide reductase
MKRLLLLLSMTLFAHASPAAQPAVTPSPPHEYIVLGGGCFWCLEAAFELVPGVKAVVNGYAGGQVANPTYEQVCSHETGHAEVVQIEYDPKEVSLDELLQMFWTIHDPTSLNRQGGDAGPQYRSIILYANEAQRQAAEKSKAAEQTKLSEPIVTEIVPLKTFYVAEAYHQDYYKNHPYEGYCQVVIRPKVAKAKKLLGQH